MSRITRVFVLTTAIVVSSLGVAAGPAQAASSSPAAGVASQSFARPSYSHRRKMKRPTVVMSPATNQTVTAGTTLTFNGSRSFDPDGGWVRYEWLGIGKHRVASRSAVYSRKFDKPGRYMVKLRVIDDEGQHAARKVWITVVAAKTEPPVVVLTPNRDLDVEFGTTISFDASKSYDPDGGAVAFEWRITEPFGSATNVVSRDSRYTHTFRGLGPGQSMSLTVIDDEGQRTTIVKNVTVYVADRFGRP